MDQITIKHPETPPPPPDRWIKKYSERILFGSDFPFIPYPVTNQIKCIEKLQIDSTLKERIFRDNALKLLTI